MAKLNNILVTGGAGYVGSTLATNLVDKGYNVRVLDSMIFGRDKIPELFEKKSIQLIDGDIRDTETLSKSLKGIDCVIHLAAITGPLCDRVPDATRQINEAVTSNMLNLCKKNKVKRFFFSSTCSNYGSNLEVVNESTPLMSLSLYSETKVRSESIVLGSKDSDFEPCVLRLATVYGVSPKMRCDLLLQEIVVDAVLKKKMQIFGPQYWRPLIHVEDVSRACISALESSSNLVSGEVYNVGSNEQNYRKIELAEMAQRYVPKATIEIQESRKDPRNYRVSFDKIEESLGFETKKTVEDGIIEIVEGIEKGNLNPQDSNFSVRSILVGKVAFDSNFLVSQKHLK